MPPIAKLLYSWSRKIHRLSLFAASFLTFLMGITGLALKYEWAARLAYFDPGLLRYLHNQLSPYFAVLLAVMMVSGLYMYLYPLSIGTFHRPFPQDAEITGNDPHLE